MKELTLLITNKQEQEISVTLHGHKIPVSVSVGTSSIALEMEDVDDLIKALHMMKSQHKTFVNVEPMGVQDLKQSSDVYEKPKPHQADYKKIEDQLVDSLTAKEIQLKVGQKYKDRKGNEFTVESEIEPRDWRYEDGYRFFVRCESSHGVRSYAANGGYLNRGQDHDADLVELIEDVPSQPDKDEHGRWILNEGDTVMLSNGVEGVVVENDESNLPYKIQFTFEDDTDHEWLYGTDDDKDTGYRIYITSIIKRAK